MYYLIFIYITVTYSQIFRHGDRTPVEPYPTDPYRDPKFWPTGFGQLTNVSTFFLSKINHALMNAG